MQTPDLESRRALRRKLQETPAFQQTCLEAFYSRLFAAVPGALPLFTHPERQHRMFALMLDLMVRDIADPAALAREMAALGRKHREKGIQPLHLKAGREAFISAVQTACPALTAKEVAIFADLFDQMTDAMAGRARGDRLTAD